MLYGQFQVFLHRPCLLHRRNGKHVPPPEKLSQNTSVTEPGWSRENGLFASLHPEVTFAETENIDKSVKKTGIRQKLKKGETETTWITTADKYIKYIIYRSIIKQFIDAEFIGEPQYENWCTYAAMATILRRK